MPDFTGIADLGTFADGQSFDISYILTRFSYYNDPNVCLERECSGILANIEDPSEIDSTCVFSSDATSSVPEPSSFAMILLGLALIGFIARRQHSKNQAV